MCDWKPMHDFEDYKCPYKNYGKSKDGSKRVCIFHSDLHDKDLELFSQGVKGLYQTGAHNFFGFVFPKEFDFKRIEKETNKDHLVFINPVFSHAEFYCDVDLSKAEFIGEGITTFYQAVFSRKFEENAGDYIYFDRGEPLFDEDLFLGAGNVSFREAIFSTKEGVSFHGTYFSFNGNVDFYKARFNCDGEVFFGYNFGKTFSKKTSVVFEMVKFKYPERVIFDRVNLSRCRFSGTDLSKVVFSEVYWHGREPYPTSSYRGRLKVFDETLVEGGLIIRLFQIFYDHLISYLYELRFDVISYYELLLEYELEEKKNFKHLKKILMGFIRSLPESELEVKDSDHYSVYNLYNQLIKNYENVNRYHEAGDFFVGMMEMRKRGDFEKRMIRALLYPYKWISLYGERPVRAFGWLLGSILLFGLFNLTFGISPIETNSTLHAIKKEVFSIRMLIDITFWKDYLQAIYTALQPITLGKVEAAYSVKDPLWGPLLRIGETVTGALFLSLFVLAMNRKFRRTHD